MAGLILKAPYYKKGHKTPVGQNRGELLQYVATRDGVEPVRGNRFKGFGCFTNSSNKRN